jgi:hypothetical protein
MPPLINASFSQYILADVTELALLDDSLEMLSCILKPEALFIGEH